MLNFHQSLSFLNWLFPLLHFSQEFPTRFSCNNFLQDFPTTFSYKTFPQDFPITISRKIFPQQFPALISRKIFPSWILIGWLPITLFQMLNFHQSLSFFNWLFPLLHFPQEFPARFSRNNFPQHFPATISHKIFLSWILIGWLPITLFQMLNFHQTLSFLNWLFPLLHFPQEFTARISHKIFLQQFPARFSHNNFLQEFPTRFSHNNFSQDFPATISRINFPQDFPELDTDWLAPHHPIPNGKFPPITAFLKLAFSPPPFPTRIYHKNFLQQFPATISHKIFPQDFPARFSQAGS